MNLPEPGGLSVRKPPQTEDMMTAPPTTHRLDAEGGELYYEVRGSGPLLLVIAQPMTSSPFAPMADLLATDRTSPR